MRCATLGLSAVGTKASCSLAWYQASTAATTAFGGRVGDQALQTGATTVDALGLKVKVTAVPNAAVKLSSSDGRSFGYKGGSIYEDSDIALGDMYSYITLSMEGIYTSDLSRAANSDELAQIQNGTTFQFTINGGTRTRLYASAPVAKANIGDAAPNNTLTITGTLTASGASCSFATTDSNKLYFSIAGQVVTATNRASGGIYYGGGTPTKALGADLTGDEIVAFWTNASSAEKDEAKDTSAGAANQTITLAAV